MSEHKQSVVPFVPTVYEHAAALIGRTPSEAARSEDLLVEGQLAAFERYCHPLVSVGLDIYNIEAEALGGIVDFPDGNDLPALRSPLVHNPVDFGRLTVPNPKTDGRMPLLLNACRRLKAALPAIISGTVTGPFTLAAIVRGFEAFTMDLYDDPAFAREQLQFAAKVSFALAAAYHELGVSVAINESWIAPPLCAPDMYREFAQPVETELISRLLAIGVPRVSLVCGGNTSAIAADMLATGTSYIMADWGCDRRAIRYLCEKRGVMLRAGIAPGMVERGDKAELSDAVNRVMADCGDYPNFVFGCGIVSYTTPPAHVLLLKQLIENVNLESRSMRISVLNAQVSAKYLSSISQQSRT
jgi:uroporphyrinogen decarboxylase